MNSAKTADTQQKAARVAGFLYLIIVFIQQVKSPEL